MGDNIKSIIADGAYNLTEDFISDENQLAGFIGFEGMVYLLQFTNVYINNIEDKRVRHAMYDQYADLCEQIAEKVVSKLSISTEEYASIFDSRCRMYEKYRKAIFAKRGETLAEYGRIYHMIFSFPIGGIPKEKMQEFEAHCLLNTDYFTINEFIARDTCVMNELCNRLKNLEQHISTQCAPKREKAVNNNKTKPRREPVIAQSTKVCDIQKKEVTSNDGCVKIFALALFIFIVLLWIVSLIFN